MNCRKPALLVIVLIVLLALVGCGSAAGTTKPFRDLKASDIAAVTVRFLPPQAEIPLDETDQLARLLRKVVVAERSAPDSNDTLCGQIVIFELDLSDGSHEEIQVCYPYIVMDGISYKAEYRPCEELNSYANRQLEKNRGK